MIRQFTYTASPWGKSGEGWMVFQQSEGMPSDLVKKLHGVYNYEEPKSKGEDVKFPVQFAYFPDESGREAVLAQTTFTGRRWFGDPRPGDFFAHVFLLDQDAVSQASEMGFNPVRLYQSKKIQSEFPADLKDKALRIYRKETAWEQPPFLPELKSLAELGQNPQLTFEAALERIPEHSVGRLGPLVYSIMLRAMGKADKPIVFDSNNENSPLFMSLALDLMPPTWRARTWFAVHFTEAALRRLPAYKSLTFFGTDASSPSDLDSGIVSGVDFSQDHFAFRSRNDVRSFKQQLDMLGADVSVEDYSGVVNCRKVVIGKWNDLEALRSAVAFAGRFPGLMEKVNNSLKNSLSSQSSGDFRFNSLEFRHLAVIASFELGLSAFEDILRRICSTCAENIALFDQMLRKLNGNGILDRFINEVVNVAAKSGKAGFINRIVESGVSFENFVRKRPEDDLLRLAADYRDILKAVRENRIASFGAESLERHLKTAGRLKSVVGGDVSEISEVTKRLEYCLEISKITKVSDVEPMLRRHDKTDFPVGVDVRRDVMGRLSASLNRVADIVELGRIFDAFKMQGTKLICDKWEEDRAEMGQLRQGRQKPEYREECKRPGCLFMVIVCLVCIGIGFFAGKRYGGSRSEGTIRRGLFAVGGFPDAVEMQEKQQGGETHHAGNRPTGGSDAELHKRNSGFEQLNASRDNAKGKTQHDAKTDR